MTIYEEAATILAMQRQVAENAASKQGRGVEKRILSKMDAVMGKMQRMETRVAERMKRVEDAAARERRVREAEKMLLELYWERKKEHSRLEQEYAQLLELILQRDKEHAQLDEAQSQLDEERAQLDDKYAQLSVKYRGLDERYSQIVEQFSHSSRSEPRSPSSKRSSSIKKEKEPNVASRSGWRKKWLGWKG
ncbi:hypothetical protein VE03_05559 [Pseudogymnoascus sp. 23342-1-I1]|nr:hypothetical protein VE03_05559 [Pseudogymnoascus sp. 23342-1-I1]